MFLFIALIGVDLVTPLLSSDIVNLVEIKTPSGWVRGYEEIYDDGETYRFIKIPYAQPPIGDLRFQKTKPIGEWEGVRGIRGTNAPQCPQMTFSSPGFDTLETDEDCLYLNIYVPGKISRDRKLSVMVWIHGGGFIAGGASQFKPQKLVLGGDVIVATINYRLGLFGFLTLHDALAPGNYGLWDQIEALRWIQNNIAAFGGNPKFVTIFGSSSGGMSVSLHTLIPSNEGLFQRVISQSGVVNYFTIARRQEETQTNELLLVKTGCLGKESIKETLKCLRNIPVNDLIEAISMFEFAKPLNVSFEVRSMIPTIDGELIKENIFYPKSWDNDVYHFFRSIDFMSGTQDGEGNLAFLFLTPDIQEKFEFSASDFVPKSVLCETFAAVYVDKVAGNSPKITHEICDFYTSDKERDEQSNKVLEFFGDSWFIGPSNNMLSIHATNNDRAKTFQYLLTKPGPIQCLPMDPPSWIKSAGHEEELHLLFMTNTDHVQTEKMSNRDGDEIDQLSKTVIKYWTNFAKYG